MHSQQPETDWHVRMHFFTGWKWRFDEWWFIADSQPVFDEEKNY